MAVYNTCGPLSSTSGPHFDMNITVSFENASHESTLFSKWDLPHWNKRFPLPNGVTGKMCLITNYYMLNNHPVEAFTWTLLTVHLIFDILFVIIYSVIGKRICIDTQATRIMSASSEHAHSFRVDLRKGSDSSAEDDVFVSSTSCTRKSSFRQKDDHISSVDTLCRYNLLNSHNSSATSIPSSPKNVLLRHSPSKHNSRTCSPVRK
ncbi:unnamed protein product [Mytilus coruscus]|uniref:Uncharacterized protein n=1 Tax=Mytilus coruscus TaxID=42192 RepID=A0A6J8D724_MYTCO|nr:unnamed protein product [Mytilus coruscus]